MKTSWWQSHCPSTRRLVQLYSALLHNAYLKGFIEGDIYHGNAKYACAPGFNCYSCPGAVASCPLGSIQNALGSAGHRAGWYVLGILLLFGVILGRTICGWLCPLGLIQELLHRIPTLKIRKSRITRTLSWLKYVILAVFVIAVPLWYGLRYDLPLPAFCKYICPVGTFEGAVGHLANPARADYYSMLGILFTRKWVILMVIGLSCIFCYRSFCRFLCPLGAIYGLFSRFNIVGVQVDQTHCNHCGACVRSCGMDVRHVGDHECIHCAKCIDHCAQKAISMKAGRITLKGPDMEKGQANAQKQSKKRGRILWGVALLFLCFCLVWFNFLDPAIRKEAPAPQAEAAVTEAPKASEAPAQTEAPAALEAPKETAAPAATEAPAQTEAPAAPAQDWTSSAPIGHEPGQQLADFSLTCYDGSAFRLQDTRGKVTFINLWATWCTPCKGELPYFNDLYLAHKEDIAILVAHPSMVTQDTPEAYLADKGYQMSFATDVKENTLWTAVGGTLTLPQTIVLNRRGEVIYNKTGSVTPEILAALYEQAAQ